MYTPRNNVLHMLSTLQESASCHKSARELETDTKIMKAVRLGAQLLVSLCLLMLVLLMFLMMNDQIYSYNKYRVNQITEEPQHQTTSDRMQTISALNTSLNKVSVNIPKLKDRDSMSAVIKGTDQTKNRTRYLIYLCDKHQLCGGWGNRQSGIVAAYVLATVTNRKYGVNMSYPCDIKLFYAPNEVDWYIKTPDIRGLSWEIVTWMDRADCCEEDFNVRHPSDVVFLRTNQGLLQILTKSPRYWDLIPEWYKHGTTGWKKGWHMLMKPSIHMDEHIDMFMANVPDTGDLVCAHIRMRRNPSIPNDGRAINSLSSVETVWKFLSKYEKTASRIFIATDSVQVRESAQKRFGRKELDTNGIVLHIDRQGGKDNACLGFEMSLLEQIVLTKCKVLVMSWSTFSIRASHMSLTKQKLFMFRNGVIRKA